jgi:isopenicillin-N N-acyltransferase-like protein
MQIPFIRVSGSHFEAGRQIGVACREQLAWAVRSDLPDGARWDDIRRAAEPYLAATRASLPWVVEEIEGAAQGAGLDPLDLFASGVEEISRRLPAVPDTLGKCSDFAAGPPATFDSGIWLGHNNDLSPDTAANLVAVEWDVLDQPRIFSVGVGGLFISTGFNAAGLSLTGNEVHPDDDRIGVPRLLIVRDILAQRTSQAAIAAALNPARASSYNNLIAHTDGTIVSVEGSAVDHALIAPPPEDGWTVHTNHYVAESMLRHEANPRPEPSRRRYERARDLMQTRAGPVTPQMLRAFLSDHDGAPASLCRHTGSSQTVFWCVIDLCHGAIEYGRGNPCQPGNEQRFAFN